MRKDKNIQFQWPNQVLSVVSIPPCPPLCLRSSSIAEVHAIHQIGCAWIPLLVYHFPIVGIPLPIAQDLSPRSDREGLRARVRDDDFIVGLSSDCVMMFHM